MSRIYIGRMESAGMSEADAIQALEWLEWEKWLPRNACVFLKPNLTWPVHLPGVTTTPQAIRAVVGALKHRTHTIIVGESDGGYHSFHAEEAFRGHGINELRQSHGVRVVNLSKEPSEEIQEYAGDHHIAVTLPKLLLHEVEVFISLPVPKVHVMTGVSLGMKNQWGCIPSTMRLREHPQFDRKIIAINRRLQPRVIFDGTFFLDGAGPMSGEAVRMELLLAAENVGAADAACCRIMGIDVQAVPHLRLAKAEGMLPQSPEDMAWNVPPKEYIRRRFRSHRALLDWISYIGFRNRGFAWIFWESPMAGLLHRFLFFMRRNSFVQMMLYGKPGPPPEWDSHS